MGKHWKYLKYVLRHKWYVLRGGLKYGASIWNLIIHDMSKFSLREWIPYANYFYTSYDKNQYTRHPWKDKFDIAWNHHQKKNPHHWQYWCLLKDDGTFKPLEMPLEYTLEMLADWYGAGKAISGKNDIREWYLKNYHVIQLHRNTRNIVNVYLGVYQYE